MADTTYSTTTSRRTILGAAVAVAAIPAAAALTPSDWAALTKAYLDASAAADRLQAIYAERDGRAIDAGRNLAPPIEPDNGPIDKSMSLAAILAETNTPEWNAAYRQYETELAAFLASRAAARAAIIGDTEERWMEADGLAFSLLNKIRAFPATSLTMLREKADILDKRYASELDADDALALIADVRRLAAQEA